jgi:hypothetical protein
MEDMNCATISKMEITTDFKWHLMTYKYYYISIN